jgi:hypothetical protein
MSRATPPPAPRPERRRHSRAEVLMQAQVSHAGEVYVLATRDVSPGGAYLEGQPEDCPEMVLGALVDCAVFREEGAPAREVHLQARIVRIDPGAAGRPPGFGVVFESLAPEERARLAAMIGGGSP